MLNNLESRLTRRTFLQAVTGLAAMCFSLASDGIQATEQDNDFIEVPNSLTFQVIGQNIQRIGNLAVGRDKIYFIGGGVGDEDSVCVYELSNSHTGMNVKPTICPLFRLEYPWDLANTVRLKANSKGELFVFESPSCGEKSDHGTLYKLSSNGRLISKMDDLYFSEGISFGEIRDIAANPVDNNLCLLVKNLGKIMAVDMDKKVTKTLVSQLPIYSNLMAFDRNGSVYAADRMEFDPPGKNGSDKTEITLFDKRGFRKIKFKKPTRTMKGTHSFYPREWVYDSVRGRLLVAGHMEFEVGFGGDYVFNVNLKTGQSESLVRVCNHSINGIDVDCEGRIYLALHSINAREKYGKVVALSKVSDVH